MDIGKVILSTTSNHLDSYDTSNNTVILQQDQSYKILRVQFACQNNDDISITASNSRNSTNSPPLTRIIASVCDEGGLVTATEDIIHHVNWTEGVTDYKYQYEKLPVLGVCFAPGFIVTVSTEHMTIYCISDNTSTTKSISPITKCTAVFADVPETSSKPSVDDVIMLFCDGSKVYYYGKKEATMIDTGRVLAFCKSSHGFLATFETNWRLSPMNIFGEGPINLESLEIPRNHTSSNEARLQLYSFDSMCLDDHSLPCHNEPTLLVEYSNLVCVSGFYKHVIGLFNLKHKRISHIKDISIGVDFRSVGLAFHKHRLLVLKRKFQSDNILLTFPSKTGTVTGDVSLMSLNLKEYVIYKSILSMSYESVIEQFQTSVRNLSMNDNRSDDEKLVTTSEGNTIKRKKKKRSHHQPVVTEQEIQQKALEILEEYKKQPCRSFSDSELSEGTLELLAECKPCQPFIPIPVTSSSEDGSEDDVPEKVPSDKLLPHIQTSCNEITGVHSSGMIDPNKLIIPSIMNVSDNSNDKPLISEIMNNQKSSQMLCAVDELNSMNKQDFNNNEIGAINGKLDKIINLLEKQTSLLEIIANNTVT